MDERCYNLRYDRWELYFPIEVQLAGDEDFVTRIGSSYSTGQVSLTDPSDTNDFYIDVDELLQNLDQNFLCPHFLVEQVPVGSSPIESPAKD